MTRAEIGPALLRALEDRQLQHMLGLESDERYSVRSAYRDRYDALERLLHSCGDLELEALGEAMSAWLDGEDPS